MNLPCKTSEVPTRSVKLSAIRRADGPADRRLGDVPLALHEPESDPYVYRGVSENPRISVVF